MLDAVGKYILVGTGQYAMEIMKTLGRARVRYFCESVVRKSEIDGIPVISLDECREKCAGYIVMITVCLRENRIVLAEELARRGIPFTIYGHNVIKGMPHRTIHIHGINGEINYEYNNSDLFAEVDQIRIDNTIALYREMFRVYKREFAGKEVDVHITIDDSLWDAYEYAKEYGWEYVHTYSTTYALSDVVIPIPDYRSCFREDTYHYADASPKLCIDASQRKYEDERAYWIGSFLNLDSRLNLWELSRKHPDRIVVESTSQDGYKPMPKQARYKYLIDVRGFGWTDRVKTLLMLGRPLFLVDRPNVEWYMDCLVPMKHYIPVKEDLSDLLEKIEFLDQSPDLYDSIVQNTKEFVKQYLSAESILKYLCDVTLTYDTKDAMQAGNTGLEGY